MIVVGFLFFASLGLLVSTPCVCLLALAYGPKPSTRSLFWICVPVLYAAALPGMYLPSSWILASTWDSSPWLATCILDVFLAGSVAALQLFLADRSLRRSGGVSSGW